jgi:hypothetical protein
MRATLQRSFHVALQRTIRSTVQRQWQRAFSFGRPSWPLNVMILPMACVQRQSWLPNLDSTTIDSRMGEPGGVVRKIRSASHAALLSNAPRQLCNHTS